MNKKMMAVNPKWNTDDTDRTDFHG
jgi:hypothetical protein